MLLLTPVTPFVVLVMSLLVPPGKIQLPFTVTLAALAFYVPSQCRSGTIIQDWFYGFWSFIFFLKHIVFLFSSTSELRYLGYPTKEKQDENAAPEESMKSGSLQKLIAAASLSSTLRGIGWSWQVKNCPLGVSLHYPRRYNHNI